MTIAAASKTEATMEHGVNGGSARFEPIKKILLRCDEKTNEYARPMNVMAA